MKDRIKYREETLLNRADEINASNCDYSRAHTNHYIEPIDLNTYKDYRRYKPAYCHVFINNISFPQSLEELKYLIDRYGQYDIEDLINSRETTWTAPRWAMAGDICLFMHAKTASITISSLKSELKEDKEFYSESDYQELLSWLIRGKQLHKRYGGKIFAVAQVIGPAEVEMDDDAVTHWKSRIFSNMGRIWLLENPIDISEFRQHVVVSSRGAITPVFGKEYKGLKKLIFDKNQNLPDYFLEAVAADAEMWKINRDTWLQIAPQYLHSYIYEKQFRIFYVDYFLSALGDIKTIYSECKCVKKDVTSLSRVDNVIRFKGRYLPVEVKLSVPLEHNIVNQLTKYCNDDEIFLDKAETRGIKAEYVYHNHVLVIDRENLFLYDDRTGIVKDIYALSSIHTMDDIAAFREKLFEMISPGYEPIKQKNRRRPSQY